MRIHPEFGALRRYSREEGGGRTGSAQRVEAHLRDCTRCRETVKWSRSVVEEYRAGTEMAAPPEAWDDVAHRVREAEAVVLPSGPVPIASSGSADQRSSRWAPFAVRAAVLMLLLAGAVAAAVPGSPLRGWLATILEEGPQPGAAAEGSAAEPVRAASFVLPTHGGVLRVVFHRPDPGLVLRVRTGAAGELTVRATGPAAAARFARAPSRLDISDSGPGEILLVLPRTGGNVRVELEGQSVLWQDADSMIVPAPVSDRAGSELMIRFGELSGEGGAP